MNKISIIGAGNGGLTAAYHLSKLGHSICLYDSPEFDTQINAVKTQGGIKALTEDHGAEMMFPGFEKISHATTDIKEAMDFAEMVIMICPSFAQELLFEQMLPHLKDGHIIFLMPGNYGGLVLNRMKNVSPQKDLHITFADGISIPWATRIVEPGVLTIMGLKEYISVSIFPSGHATDKVKQLISDSLPVSVEFLANPVVAGLENINFGGHPLLTALNMGLLENFRGDFNYYRDCCSPATANAAAKMDKERLAVGEALGFTLKTELEAMNALYGTNYETVYDFNRDSKTHGKINTAPDSSKNRYITEDVPYLLVPCFELATAAGIRVPIVESCIHIASAYNNEDYFKTGRTLQDMGLTSEELKSLAK
ncbi:NAD/NADP-dependent octopine/nopaline dehydrogenase family protein [Sporosarcina sp. P33]|uniref:NAD/NADP-dependent octopine/nopaline dehydrogenase family protein n=1 Tax=Sporosarcina sp. P33 TaxID=1930764 RepID=UPI0009BCF944|nr:NAD/NADP-dependent octopine/nopaline dehydrogenase family protein [Sporosarcina sp. P33]ARD47092.1 nopaline dehydrogenase [Sporosarcina sp. P33]